MTEGKDERPTDEQKWNLNLIKRKLQKKNCTKILKKVKRGQDSEGKLD